MRLDKVISQEGLQLLHVILNSLMQYVLCPRCKFKVPANKHLCSTCGYVMPVFQSSDVVSRSTVIISPGKQQGFWATLFGVGEQPKEEEQQDQDDVNQRLVL